MKNKCKCVKEENEPLMVRQRPVDSNKIWELKHKRNYFELWLDQYNHILEFIRTIVQILVFFMQTIILWRLFQ